MPHTIIEGENSAEKIGDILSGLGAKKYLLVCGGSFDRLPVRDCFDRIRTPRATFREFSPNPLYEEVCKGVELFNREKCDAIVAVGGGSAIDVAKCIKLYCRMDPGKSYLSQPYRDSKVPLIAVPTTAGSGSESTRYAVLYIGGRKQSVTHESIVPDYAVLDHRVLGTLPVYQKKCTLLDALCQAIESWWSINSTEESKGYARNAIETIMRYKDDYIRDCADEAARKIMAASNYSGRAINITRTTAAHAMSYMLTTLYKLPHGHAVSVCLPKIWRYMLAHPEQCIDRRGKRYVTETFEQIGRALGANTAAGAIDVFEALLPEMGIEPPQTQSASDMDILSASVNPERLNNNPVHLDKKALRELYEQIVTLKTEG